MQNAATIPSLFLNDPLLTLQALQVVACENNIVFLQNLLGMGGIATAASRARPSFGTGAGTSIRFGPGALAALLGFITAGILVLPFAVPIADTSEPDDEQADCDPNCVVRGGTASIGSFISGYALRREDPKIYGFSVLYRPGINLKDLAYNGMLPNRQLSYVKDTDIVAAGAARGYVVTIPLTTGRGGNHATVTVSDTSGNNTPAPLPTQLDEAFSTAFNLRPTIPNPNPLYG